MSSGIRQAALGDVPEILALIRELAAYEHAEDSVEATEASLRDTLFGAVPYARVALILHEGAVAGMGLYFTNYSTWKGKPGIYLEDLFVRPQYRKKGYGVQLLAYLAEQVKQINGARLEWSVLLWNKPSIDFYESLGAENLGKEWQTMRVTGPALDQLSSRLQ